jgi:hypothetical protein
MHPRSFLSTARARTRSPVPFCTASPSLALCPRRSASLETRARCASRPVHQKPHQATPSSTPRWAPVPMLGFPNCALLLANFGFVGGWSWMSPAPARWAAKLARSSDSALTPSVPLTLLKLVQALAPQTPSQWLESLTGVTPTHPESSFSHSPLSDPSLTATTLPLSLSCLSLRFWPAPVTPEPLELAPAPTPATSPLREGAAPPQPLTPPWL